MQPTYVVAQFNANEETVMAHSHAHGDVNDGGHAHGSHRTLLLALCLTTIFAIVEAVAGWWSNSLALIGDAGHMITDSMALGLGALAAWMSRKPASPHHSYGLLRAETLGALLNVLFMIGVITYIGVEAFERLSNPEPVNGPVVVGVGIIGLLINIGAAWILHGGEQNLNVKGAMLHVMGDLLGSVAAVVAGAVIWVTGWYPIDPILSAFIGLLILVSSLRLLRAVMSVLMEGVPPDVDMREVGECIAEIRGVQHVHDLHIWMLDSNTYALSAHVVISSIEDWEQKRTQMEALLAKRFSITHVTLQPETESQFNQACEDGSCGTVYSSTISKSPSTRDS